MKAASESFDKMFCFIEPTARWQRIICSSMGNLEAMVKKASGGSNSWIESDSRVRGWLELKQVITQENYDSIQSSQVI